MNAWTIGAAIVLGVLAIAIIVRIAVIADRTLR